MTLHRRSLVSAIALTYALAATANATGPNEFEYPELHVAPRASERLKTESERESANRFLRHVPTQVSALMTTASGVVLLASASDHTSQAKIDLATYAGLSGLGLGGAWLGTTIVLSILHTPYATGLAEINGMPNKTTREQISRERVAEQHIESAASLGRKLMWLSVISNLGVSGFMIAASPAKSTAQVMSAGSALLAFTPLLFSPGWIQVAEEQREYKKKIYAPVAFSPVLIDPASNRLAPGMALSFLF